MLFRVSQELFPGSKIPFTPGGDDADIGLQSVIAKLKAHLIIALACSPVGDRIRLCFPRNLDLAFGNQRARNTGTQQIFPLINRVGTKHGKNKITRKLFAKIFYEYLLNAELFSFCACRLDFLALADIRGEGDDFTLIGVL